MFAAKTDDLSLIPGSHVVEGEDSLKLSSALHTCHMSHLNKCAYAQKQRNVEPTRTALGGNPIPALHPCECIPGSSASSSQCLMLSVCQANTLNTIPTHPGLTLNTTGQLDFGPFPF